MKKKPSKSFLKLLDIVNKGTNKQREQLLTILIIQKISRLIEKKNKIMKKRK